MRMKMRTARTASLLALAMVLIAAIAVGACGSSDDDAKTGATTADSGNGEGLVSRKSIKIEFASIGVPGTPFYKVVRNGAEQAGRDLGVEVTYRETQQADGQEQARLIEAAIARKPDALVVTDDFPDVLDAKIAEAVEAGIPTIVINALGPDTMKKTGALAYIGQNERDVGRQAGEEMRAAGVKKVLCVLHFQGAVSLTDRCRGLADAYPKGDVKDVAVDGNDRSATRNGLKAAIQSNPDFDGMLTLGDSAAEPAVQAIGDVGRDVKLGTIDLSPQVLAGVADGKIMFASDQQQFLQGYLPVQQLVAYLEYGLRPPEFTPTGPHYVTNDNARAVIQLTERGIR